MKAALEKIEMNKLTEMLVDMSVGDRLYFGFKDWDGDPTVMRVDCLNPLGNVCWLIAYDEGVWLAADGAYQGPLEYQIREWLESFSVEKIEFRTVYRGGKAQEFCDYLTDSLNDPEWATRPMWFHDDMDRHVAGLWQEGDKWVAFDNSSGDNWVEEFKTELDALMWIYDYREE